MGFLDNRKDLKELLAKALDALELHPQYGLNIHPVMCSICNRFLNLAIPLGKKDIAYECKVCKKKVAFGVAGAAPECTCGAQMTMSRVLEEGEPITVGMKCERCEEDAPHHEKVVGKNGIYVRCPMCNAVGSMSRTSAKGKEVLKALAKHAKHIPQAKDQIVSVTIHPKEHCPRCAQLLDHPAYTEDELKNMDLSKGMEVKDDGKGDAPRSRQDGKVDINSRFTFTAPGSRTAH